MASIDTRTSPSGKVTYRARTRLKGFPQQVATFTDITDAKKWAQATEVAQLEGRHFVVNEAKRHTLAELIDRYDRDVLPQKPKNARAQRRQLAWWKQQLRYCVLADVTPAKIAEARDHLLRTPMPNGRQRAPATAVRYLAVLSHAFSVAMKEWGWVNDNPLRKVSKPKEPPGRVRFLDDDERAALLAACKASKSPLLYPIVVLALATVMRKGEVLGLRWEQVDFARERITLHETKNGERRGVPLVKLALVLLQGLAKKHRADTPLVFTSPTVARPLDITKAFSTALATARVANFRFHALRHSAASYLVMNGASLAEVGEVLGHKSVQMTKRYAHMADSHLRDIVAAMNEKVFAKAGH